MESQSREIVLYVDSDEVCHLEEWLDNLRDRQARIKIKKRIDRLEMGNFGDYKSVGEGVCELRIDYGPGYRIYFATIGSQIILLLCGGDKSSQPKDILNAKQYWTQYQETNRAQS